MFNKYKITNTGCRTMNKELYIDCRHSGESELVSRYLELHGFKYGYSGYNNKRCQRRAYSNMPFITVRQDTRTYCGSKGAATNVKWEKITRNDIETMKKELHNMSKLESDEYLLVNEFRDKFGSSGYKSMLRNYGPHYDDVTEMPRKRFKHCIKQMKEQLKIHTARNILGDTAKLRENHRLVMSDEERLERVWTTANGREIPVSKMEDDHLHNTILFIDRKMREGAWCLGINEDLPELIIEMEEERIRREIPLPLVPIKSLSYRRRTQND